MKDNTFTISTGVAVVTVGAFLIATVLRLGGFIAWPWWLITSPIWVTFCVVLICVIFVIIYTRNDGRK